MYIQNVRLRPFGSVTHKATSVDLVGKRHASNRAKMAAEFAKNIDENPTRARRDRLDRLKARFRWPSEGIEDRGIHRYSPFNKPPIQVERAPNFVPTAVPDLPSKAVLQSLGRGDDQRYVDSESLVQSDAGGIVGPQTWYPQYMWALAKDARRIRPPLGWGMQFKSPQPVRPAPWQYLNKSSRKTLFNQSDPEKWDSKVSTVLPPEPPRGFVHATPMQEYEDAQEVVARAFKPFNLRYMRQKVRAFNAKRGDAASKAALEESSSKEIRDFIAASKRLERLGHYEHLGIRPGTAITTDNMHRLALATLAKNSSATHEERIRLRSQLAHAFSPKGTSKTSSKISTSTANYMKRIVDLSKKSGKTRGALLPRRARRSRGNLTPQSVPMAYWGGITLV